MTLKVCPSEIADLRARFAAGDPTAETQFYDRFAPGLRAVVRRLLRHRLPASPLELMCARRFVEDECIYDPQPEDAIVRRLLKSLLVLPLSESTLQTLAQTGTTRPGS